MTVTTSDLRKNGICSGGSKSSSVSVSSMDSNSPPIRRPFSLELDDLSNTNNAVLNLHHASGTRMSNPAPTKITSSPASSGGISFLSNHNGTSAGGSSGSNNSANHHFPHHHHLLKNHYNNGDPAYPGLKLMPIKSEPSVN